MKRRTFIWMAAGTAATVTASFLYYRFHKYHFESGNPLSTPDNLANYCDEKELISIGKEYLRISAAENKAATLTSLLLTDTSGKIRKFSADLDCYNFLTEKVKADFTTGATLVLNGWVLSVTEARQCALLSLN